MKNEKLESLLNKVVEFYKPDACHFKGFLYKDRQGYYIKVVETINGTDIAVNDKLYLKEGEDQYIVVADKPKLMRVSLKSWHYLLMKYVLKSKTPTPQTMQNGCPYYWLVVFSLLVCPFLALWNSLKFIFLLIPEFFIMLLEKSVDNWIKNVDDISAYEMDNNKYSNSKGKQKLPLTAKVFFDSSKEDFMDYFIAKKYGELDHKARKAKSDEIYAKWDAWRKEVREEREKLEAERYEREKKWREEEAIRMEKAAKRKAEWDARMQPIKDSMSKLSVSIKETFTFKGDIKTIIKRTKQIVGAFVTLFLLAVAFFVVEGLAYALIAFIDFSIRNWEIYAGIALLAIAAGLIYFIGIFIGGWLQRVVNEYNKGKKVWYIEPVIYLLWYPVKYIGLFLGYSLFYIIWTPIKFIFYTVIWKYFLVFIGQWVWKFICAFGRGLAESTGVFGEYFSASYTDYCPGIEWVDVEEEQN